jgi:hypothetical protein
MFRPLLTLEKVNYKLTWLVMVLSLFALMLVSYPKGTLINFPAAWQYYTSGIMTWEECAWINTLDHCVQLVGYNTENDDSSYWIVRNRYFLVFQ